MHPCLPCPQLSELVRFLPWELSVAFYLVHRHSVCLVDRVDFICSLYSWWEGFGSSLKSTAPGFQLWFYFHLCMCVIHWGLLLRLPWRTWACPCDRCGLGTGAWVAGVLAAPGTQGYWRLGQQEIQCSRRVRQPALANML